jgi:hypothetical protein
MHADAMRHLDAIEAILNGTSAAGTTGSANPADAKPSAKAPTSLDKAQIEQIRTHIAALRRAMNESNK